MGRSQGLPGVDAMRRGSPGWLPAPRPADPSGRRGIGKAYLVLQALPSVVPFPVEEWLHRPVSRGASMRPGTHPQGRLSPDRKGSLPASLFPRGWGTGPGPGPIFRDCSRRLPAEAQGGPCQPGHTLCLQEALLLAQRGDALLLQEC